MRMYALKLLPCSVLLAALALGCQPSPTHLLKMDESQAELRAMQTRVFETADEHQMLRVVIGTLQDLGFVIHEADHRLGLVSGTKFHANLRLRMTVTVRSQGDAQLVVRAAAEFGLKAVRDPEPYQEFFASLDKSWFLAARTAM